MRILLYLLFSTVLLFACREVQDPGTPGDAGKSTGSGTSLIVLGTIQDGGSPHIGCPKDCCRNLFANPDKTRQVVCLGLYDEQSNKRYLFEATPDLPRQAKTLSRYGKPSGSEMPDGIFLTHAHIGHYAGLMFLGKEATDARGVPVYVMPRMKGFLETNGPWSQLVTRRNILLKALEHGKAVSLSPGMEVTPLLVPHRDEYSETVGYRIKGPRRQALFIPDIDKWEKWDKNILEQLAGVDYLFIDATFYSGEEINNRDISQIPHPFVTESMEKFEVLNREERSKIIFIHFNHTNPLLNPEGKEAQEVLRKGFRIASPGDVFAL